MPLKRNILFFFISRKIDRVLDKNVKSATFLRVFLPFCLRSQVFFQSGLPFFIYDRERLSSSLALAPQLGRKKGGAKDGRQTWGSNPRRCIPLLFLLLEGQPPQTELSLPLQSQNGSKECQVLLRLRQA